MRCAIRPVWVEVDLDHLVFNIRQIRRHVGSSVKIMGVVKCNAYGTGWGVLATMVREGVDMFGVAILDEALQIRKVGIELPVLVFTCTPFEHSDLLIAYDIRQAVYRWEQAAALSQAARRLNRTARIHLKIDTGMGRLGFIPSPAALETMVAIARLPNLEIEGVYTHCPFTNERSAEGVAFTQEQYRLFMHVVRALEERGVNPGLKHTCNSMGAVYYPRMHLDMVRAGIILYGSYPRFQDRLPLKAVLSLKARIALVKEVGPGQNISYGRLYTTTRRTKVATLPIGYGDGLNRMLSNRGEVLINGRRAPIIGAICMDQCMVDVSSAGRCRVGDEAVIIGRQGEEEITVEEVAQKICGYINYEYMVLIHHRVPRCYRQGGKPVINDQSALS